MLNDVDPTGKERLLEVWKVLEALVVSLDRMGALEAIKGLDSASALAAYFTPALFKRLAHARTQVITLLEEYEPTIISRLERLAEDEDEIGYWQGERQA